MKYPDRTRSFAEQEEDVLLAMCIFGEARGESDAARLGVAHVVRNRVRSAPRYGKAWRGVILKPRQFSCFLASDPNAPKLRRPLACEPLHVWRRCWEIACAVYAGVSDDNTAGATHYFDDSLAANPPRWARSMTQTVKLGRLNFFREPQ